MKYYYFPRYDKYQDLFLYDIFRYGDRGHEDFDCQEDKKICEVRTKREADLLIVNLNRGPEL